MSHLDWYIPIVPEILHQLYPSGVDKSFLKA